MGVLGIDVGGSGVKGAVVDTSTGKLLSDQLFPAASRRVFAPAHFIVGGGASKELHKFADQIDITASIRVAEFRNNAGIAGAAIAAQESRSPT